MVESLNAAYKDGKTIYPKKEDTFRAFTLTPFESVKVVILGQDPYHGPSQAHGLSFSVPTGVKKPPSLRNICLELQDDIGIEPPPTGNLTGWAKQGVLLLNASLTVEAHHPASHASFGWQTFTDTVIQTLNDHPKPIVFFLWGAYARAKAKLIKQEKHLLIQSPHPSPLSAYRGFLGSKPFSQANDFLQLVGRKPIDWLALDN